MSLTRFAFLTDLHYGHERRNGHKVPLHDLKAFGATYAFLEDFQPDVLILGGDWLDCGAVSRHNKGKPGRTEGIKLLADAEGCRNEIMAPLSRLKAKRRSYLIGNHEVWLDLLAEEEPGYEGLSDIRQLLNLSDWDVIPQGEYTKLGKLLFVHGDKVRGGENCAKNAVIDYETSVRFGHFHTYAVHTKTSAVDVKLGRTGTAVPCLCTKDPKYGEGRPNRWVQGLDYGYIFEDGTFADQVSIITNGRMVANGKVYRG